MGDERRIKIFGVERNIDFPDNCSISEDDIRIIEARCGENCEHGWFDSVVKDTKLHYRKWLPIGKPKAIVICAHGIQAHSCSGKAFRSEWLNQEGYAVYAHDYFGHGFSEGKRWLIPETWKNNLTDYCNFVNLVAEQNERDVPLFLMGDSYGAVLTIHLARQFQDQPETGPKIDSIILTAPALEVDLPPFPLVFALRYVGAPLFPNWIPPFMPNPVTPDRIWRNSEQILDFRANDPAERIQLDSSGTPFRLGTADNLLKAIEAARDEAIPGFRVPYCLLHGTRDEICLIEGSEYMWETGATPVNDREFHRLDGVYHDPFSDPDDAKSSMKLVTDWIKKRLAGS